MFSKQTLQELAYAKRGKPGFTVMQLSRATEWLSDKYPRQKPMALVAMPSDEPKEWCVRIIAGSVTLEDPIDEFPSDRLMVLLGLAE